MRNACTQRCSICHRLRSHVNGSCARQLLLLRRPWRCSLHGLCVDGFIVCCHGCILPELQFWRRRQRRRRRRWWWWMRARGRAVGRTVWRMGEQGARSTRAAVGCGHVSRTPPNAQREGRCSVPLTSLASLRGSRCEVRGRSRCRTRRCVVSAGLVPPFSSLFAPQAPGDGDAYYHAACCPGARGHMHMHWLSTPRRFKHKAHDVC
jgi:hypothetical protein